MNSFLLQLMAFAWLDVCHVEWQFYEAGVIRKIK